MESELSWIVAKILICLVVGFLLWLVKTVLVEAIASSFHVRKYFDRIQEALFNQYVIERLSGPPTISPSLKTSSLSSSQNPKVMRHGRLQRTSHSGKSSRISCALFNKEDDEITIDYLRKLNHKNVSTWNMKRLIDIVWHGSLTTLDADESAQYIKNEYEAEAAGEKIFQNVAKQGSSFIFLEDLLQFLSEVEAEKFMSLFEGESESKRISKSALKNWMVEVFKERKSLSLTLEDMNTAINTVHLMVDVVLGIIIVNIGLLIMGIITAEIILLVISLLLLFAFIFRETCNTIVKSIIFLFVTHPFDVGDRCEIDGVQMVVEEMNISATVFLDYDHQRINIPNSVLTNKAISNYKCSPGIKDVVEFCIHISTSGEKIALMRHRISSYVNDKKDHWYPQPVISVTELEGLDKVRIKVLLRHKIRHYDNGERRLRRTLLIQEIVGILQDLDMHNYINVRT